MSQKQLYRITFNAGGYSESDDLQQLKDMQVISPGPIVAFKRSWAVTNDPQMREFDNTDEADAAILQLGAEQFQLSHIDFMDDPQPEGLN